MSRIPLFNSVRSLWSQAGTSRVRDAQTIEKINQQSATFQSCTDQQIAQHTDQLRQEVQSGTAADNEAILVPGLALVNEAMRRVLGISLYDVQLQGGLTLVRRTIAEMQTGEGKTFVTAIPAYLRALEGRGVHVMTVNAYLAERDHQQLASVFDLLGMTTGLLQPEQSHDDKRAAYHSDVTYGPGYEFGFDYLRDQVAHISKRKPRLGENYRTQLQGRLTNEPTGVQRGFAYAVIDEIDSVMIDEAATPLLISAGSQQSSANTAIYNLARDVAARLVENRHYLLDRSASTVLLTERGNQQVAEAGKQASQYGLLRPWSTYVEQALRAELILRCDMEYIVDKGQIKLVDGNTGRIFADRSWRDGLHQAEQAKEGVAISGESRPLARMSRQRFFSLYEGICGLTGTATISQREFWDVYKLGVVPIELRKPSQRIMHPFRFFGDTQSKFSAIAALVQQIHQTGQPILVGTRTIESSQALANLFEDKNITFQLLNGKQDAPEASIIAGAGQRGSVTIATNMAGRGTDIKLGDQVVELGGLFVIGAEPNESARVDRQLAGRAARQGEPGACQFFISADDRLVSLYAPRLAKRMKRLCQNDGEIPIDYSREVAKVQRNCERMQTIRRHRIFAQDDWLEEVLSRLTKES